MKKHFVIAFLLAAMTTQAQEITFWEKVNNMVTKYPGVDTTRIYQPKAGFSLGLFTTSQKAGFDVDDIFDIVDDEGNSMPATTTYSLSENLCDKIGLEVGYGKVILGYSLEVGPKSALKKRSLALNILGRSWGLHFNYFSISNPFKTGIELGQPESESYWHD